MVKFEEKRTTSSAFLGPIITFLFVSSGLGFAWVLRLSKNYKKIKEDCILLSYLLNPYYLDGKSLNKVLLNHYVKFEEKKMIEAMQENIRCKHGKLTIWPYETNIMKHLTDIKGKSSMEDISLDDLIKNVRQNVLKLSLQVKPKVGGVRNSYLMLNSWVEVNSIMYR